MAIESIISLLVAERDRLNVAIGLLSDGAGTKRRGRPRKNPLANAPAWVLPKPKIEKKKSKRIFTAKQRAQQARRMKLYWRNKKKAAAAAA